MILGDLLFYESVHTAATSLGAVEEVRATDEPRRVELRVRDALPGEREPWVVRVERVDDFVHPLFGDRYSCIQLVLPMWTVHPLMPGYLDVISATAGPCLDQQRFCLGARATWNPDTGEVSVHGHLRLWDQPQSVLMAELLDAIRAVIGLAYLVSFRMWQLELRRRTPEEASRDLIAETHRHLLELLDARPPA